MIDTVYIISLVGFLSGLVLAYFWYDKNKSDKYLSDYVNEIKSKFEKFDNTVKTISDKQTEHDTKFVTDQRVRDIVKDEIKPLREDVTDVKSKVGEMYTTLNDVVTELKISNAIRQHEKDSKTRSTDL